VDVKEVERQQGTSGGRRDRWDRREGGQRARHAAKEARGGRRGENDRGRRRRTVVAHDRTAL
jgi:hypothetical protein